jgi:hypothetical protein
VSVRSAHPGQQGGERERRIGQRDGGGKKFGESIKILGAVLKEACLKKGIIFFS